MFPKGGGALIPVSIGVTLDPNPITVFQLSLADATVYDQFGGVLTGYDISWSSSDEGVATVSEGSVLGVSPGFANIIATVGGVSGYATIEVTS